MISPFLFVIIVYLSENIYTTLAMPQNVMPDSFSDSAKWFEQMASLVNKDFKPIQFQTGTAAQDTQPQSNPIFNLFTPEEVWYRLFNPAFPGGPCGDSPCPGVQASLNQPNPASQSQQNTGFQDQTSSGFQAQSGPEFQAK